MYNLITHLLDFQSHFSSLGPFGNSNVPILKNAIRAREDCDTVLGDVQSLFFAKQDDILQGLFLCLETTHTGFSQALAEAKPAHQAPRLVQSQPCTISVSHLQCGLASPNATSIQLSSLNHLVLDIYSCLILYVL